MTNKLYSKFRKFIKENILYMIPGILIIISLFIPLPYVIKAPGGLTNLDKKIQIDNSYSTGGSINLTYVTEYDCNAFMYLVAKLNKNWDLVKINVEEEKIDDDISRILLNNSLSNAEYVAFNSLNKEITIKESNLYVLYIDEFSNTNLKLKDIIKEVNGIKVNSILDYMNIVKKSNIGDILTIKTSNNEEKYIEVKEYNGEKNTYIYIECNYKYDNDIKFNFKKNEMGSSAGLMITLSIYNKLTNIDITKGRTIAGTGTIDTNGNVGEIGGIKYKIKGISKSKVDVFFLPYKNYDEAKEVKEENNYDITLVPVHTFDDVINYLNSL